LVQQDIGCATLDDIPVIPFTLLFLLTSLGLSGLELDGLQKTLTILQQGLRLFDGQILKFSENKGVKSEFRCRGGFEEDCREEMQGMS